MGNRADIREERPRPGGSRLWSHLRRNWGLKVAALLVAGALWTYATATAERTRTFNVPVTLLNIPPGTIVTAGTERSVPVLVRGRGIDLLAVEAEEFSAVVNLQGHRPGSLVHRLTTADVKPPPGYDFTILNILRDGELRITLDAEKTSLIRVRPLVIGQPPEGMTLTSTSSRPEWIRLRGPAGLLATMDYIETAPVDVSGLTSSGSVKVALMPTSPGLELIEDNLVIVELELSPAETRKLELPVTLEEPPTGLRASLEPNVVEVVVTAPTGLLDEPQNLRLIVQAPLPLSGVYEVEVQPRLPSGVIVRRIQPPRVRLTLTP